MSALQQLLNNEDIVGINSRITQLLEADADVEEIEEESGKWAIQEVSGLTLPKNTNKKGEGKPLDVLRSVLDVQATFQLMGGEGRTPQLQSALARIVQDRIGTTDKAHEVADGAYQAVFDDLGYLPAKSGERMKDRLNRIAEIQQNGGSGLMEGNNGQKKTDTGGKATQAPNVHPGNQGGRERQVEKNVSENKIKPETKATESGNSQSSNSNSQSASVTSDPNEIIVGQAHNTGFVYITEGIYSSPNGSMDPNDGKHGTAYMDRETGIVYCILDDGTQVTIAYIESTTGAVTPVNQGDNTNTAGTGNEGSQGQNAGSDRSEETESSDDGNDDDDDDDDDEKDDDTADEADSTTDSEKDKDEKENPEAAQQGTPNQERDRKDSHTGKLNEQTQGRLGKEEVADQKKGLELRKNGKGGTINPNPEGGNTPGGELRIKSSAREVEAKLLLIASKGTNSTPTFEKGRSYGHTVEELEAIIVILGASGAPTKPIVNPATNPNSPVTGKHPPAGPAPKGESVMKNNENGDDPEPGEGESPANKPGVQGTNSPSNILNPPTPVPGAPVNKNLKGSKNLKTTGALKRK